MKNNLKEHIIFKIYLTFNHSRTLFIKMEVTNNRDFRYVSSQRQNKLVIRNYFKLSHDGKFPNNGNSVYKCKVKDCKFRLTINDKDIIIKELNEHNHKPDPELEKSLAKQLVHDQINNQLQSSSQNKSRHLYNQAISNVADQLTIDTMPSFDSVKSTINRKKQKINPPEATKASDLVLDKKWKMTLIEQEEFLQADEIFKGERILVFFKKSFVDQLLQNIEHPIMFIDGTFKSAAKMFKQSFTIHFAIENHGIPAIYCLLENKKQTTYEQLFKIIKNILGLDNITTVMVDYEKAIHNALRTVFPNIQVKGCWFHFTQAILRNLGSVGLKSKYKNNLEFRLIIQHLFNLALIPLEEIDKVYNQICDLLKAFDSTPSYKDNIQKFLNYCYSTWFAPDALFDRSIWNF